jgi:uncharacterized protein (TIGR01244 family)
MRILILLACLTGLTVQTQADDIGLIELFNYYEYSPRLASAGQPSKEQLAGIAEAGIEAVINLAPVISPGAYADEGELIRDLGMAYVHIPVDWEQPPLADLEAFLAAMDQFGDKRILVHCAANARASVFVYLWRTLKAGHNTEEAHKTLVEIWDKNEGYELINVPHWVAFIEQAETQVGKQL